MFAQVIQAEDAVHEVFLRAWRACATFEPDGEPLRCYTDVAAELGVPPGTVRSRTFYGLRPAPRGARGP